MAGGGGARGPPPRRRPKRGGRRRIRPPLRQAAEVRGEIRVRLCGAAVAGLLVLVGCGPQSTPHITAPARSTGVAARVLELYDPGRPTGITPGRQLPTQVRYPESG